MVQRIFQMILIKKDFFKKIHNFDKYSNFASFFILNKNNNSFILAVASIFIATRPILDSWISCRYKENRDDT